MILHLKFVYEAESLAGGDNLPRFIFHHKWDENCVPQTQNPEGELTVTLKPCSLCFSPKLVTLPPDSIHHPI